MARILEGKPVAAQIRQQIAAEVARLAHAPVLASVIVGEPQGARAYVQSQRKAAEELSIDYRLHALEASASEQDVAARIRALNEDPAVHGIVVQMPLPAPIDYRRISMCIAPEKDVEGMHAANLCGVFFGTGCMVPCTVAAVMELLKQTGVALAGKEAVIVGHSEIVGKPLALMLLAHLATTTVCHIGTFEAGKLQEHVARAEILVVAVGKAGLIKGSWVRPGAIVIDVGINRVNDKVVGDVEFDAAASRAAWITPVPGGVGPLTVTMLMRNVVIAARQRVGR